MKHRILMPKEHFDAIVVHLGRDEALKTVRRTETAPKHKTPEVIDQCADYEDSMKILKQNDLRPLTYQEAFVHLMNNPVLKEALKGKWFWLADAGLDVDGYQTIDDKGNLTPGRGHPDETVYAYPSSSPLSLVISRGLSARDDDRQFDLGLYGLHHVAMVVVGVKT